MEQRISLITLAVADLEATKRFYCQGLGWVPDVDVVGEVLMLRGGPALLLSLWDRAHFEAEVGPVMTGPGAAPLTLAHNVDSPEAVDLVLAEATQAGAPYAGPGEWRDWGGYSGYFADPDGFRWEIAFNPGAIADIVLPGAR